MLITGIILILVWFFIKWLCRIGAIFLVMKIASGAVKQIKEKGEGIRNDKGEG